ncbi:MAG: SH3 domain-containing protein [Acidimicrobiales bacterium]|nr:SH3 domain-containing protein [Acidimicrobiales bacterium]
MPAATYLRGRNLIVAGTAALLAAACSGSGHSALPPATTRPGPTTTSTVPGVQTSGKRTVISPTGLHVRAQADKAAQVLATAAQGTVLTVLSYSGASGGWYQVKGATVTGWITSDPTLSASGEFRPYSSADFNALLPATWTSTPVPPASVSFAPPSGGDNVTAITAPNVTSLPNVPAGYGQTSSQQVVICGVTSRLLSFSRVGGAPATTVPSSTTVPTGALQAYMVEVKLRLEAQHALGFYANLSDVGDSLQTFEALVYSVSFPFPVCSGG